jgi:glycosyltransferase involved in cell wall biosynthesis
MHRLVFDLTSSCHWSGSPVGIIRVERELAKTVLKEGKVAVVFSVFNPHTGRFDRLRDDVARLVLAGAAVVRRPSRPVKRGALAAFFRQPRRGIIHALERIRTRVSSTGHLHLLLGHAVSIVRAGSQRKQRDALDPNNPSARVYRYSHAIMESFALSSHDTIFSCGLDWDDKSIYEIQQLKRKYEFRLVGFCYDVVPWKFPHYTPTGIPDIFVPYLVELSWFANKVLVLSDSSRHDYLEFCAHFMIPPPVIEKIFIDPLTEVEGERKPHAGETPLSSFVLMVGTFEPRKNHRLAYLVWERLIERNEIPGHIVLVLAGRPGWKITELFQEIRDNPVVRGRILILEGPTDHELAWLYRNCLFTLLPSFYEGFGLPVTEGHWYGKICVASARGAITELVEDPEILLDPFDYPAWERTLRDLINNPMVLARHEAAIGKKKANRTGRNESLTLQI